MPRKKGTMAVEADGCELVSLVRVPKCATKLTFKQIWTLVCF